MSHTYATLEVSQATYDEISAKLSEAGYFHAFDHDQKPPVIDMHGIGLVRAAQPVLGLSVEVTSVLYHAGEMNVRPVLGEPVPQWLNAGHVMRMTMESQP